MWNFVRRWRDETGDTYVLGVVRVSLGMLLFWNALRASRELKAGYFGDFFHWPILPESLVPSRDVYVVIVAAQALLSAMVVAGHRARRALFMSSLLGLYILLCDRLQYHNNRAALFFYSLLLSLSPCDRSLSVDSYLGPSAGPLWAARLAQVQVCVIYVASGGSKLLDPDWRSGRVLLERFVLFGGQALDQGVPVGVLRWATQPSVAMAFSKLAIATELLLAVGLWSKHGRVVALWWGVWFHLVIEVTSGVEGFTWLTLAMYALFCSPEVRTRKLRYDRSRWRGRIIALTVLVFDWLSRFDVKPWAPDTLGRGHAVVVIRRDGTPATGIRALAALARCVPVLFPLWAPLALIASFTESGDLEAEA